MRHLCGPHDNRETGAQDSQTLIPNDLKKPMKTSTNPSSPPVPPLTGPLAWRTRLSYFGKIPSALGLNDKFQLDTEKCVLESEIPSREPHAKEPKNGHLGCTAFQNVLHAHCTF